MKLIPFHFTKWFNNTPANTRIHRLSKQSWQKSNKESSHSKLFIVLRYISSNWFMKSIEANFTSDDLQRMWNCDGDDSSCKGGKKCDFFLEVLRKDIIFKISISVVMEEWVYALSSYGWTKTFAILSEGTLQ